MDALSARDAAYLPDILDNRESMRTDNPRLPFDPRRPVNAIVAKWRWVVCAGIVLAMIGFSIGYLRGTYCASAKLLLNHSPTFILPTNEKGNASAEPPGFQTVVNVLQSTELSRRLSTNSNLAGWDGDLASHLTVVRDADLLSLQYRSRDLPQAVETVNAYAEAAVQFTKELQASELREINRSLEDQLRTVDHELEQANDELVQFQRAAGWVDFDRETSSRVQQRAELDQKAKSLASQLETLDLQIKNLVQEISKQSPAMLATKEALDLALMRYTEEHPKVKELRAAMAALESQALKKEDQLGPEVAARGSSVAGGLYTQVVDLRTQKTALGKQLEDIAASRRALEDQLKNLPEKQWRYDRLKSEAQSLRQRREMLRNRQHEAEVLEANATGYCRLFERASLETTSRYQRLNHGLRWAVLAGILGVLLTSLVVAGTEMADRRIRSPEDLRRVTRLPVIAILDDLMQMSPQEQEAWAFRTFLTLKGRLTRTPNEAMVCGFISSRAGEGRSTWIRLLADAAAKQGYRVVTVSTEAMQASPSRAAEHSASGSEAVEVSDLTSPNETPKALLPPASQPILRVPLPGWVWKLERREEWHKSLQHWKDVENLMVLAELPPASQPEGILLAGHLPQLIWLAGKDMATADETRAQIETLRDAKSNLVGTVFNRADRSLPRSAPPIA